MQIFTIILTSVVVAAASTSIFTLVGQWLERRSNHKRWLFTKAVKLAKMKTDFLVQFSKDTENTAAIHDYVAYAEIYYWLLERLHEDGRLPENWREEITKKFPLANAAERRY